MCPTLLGPHELQPARLLCLWDFPGKNTGVGCHFLLQRIFPTQRSNLGLLHCRWRCIYLLRHHNGRSGKGKKPKSRGCTVNMPSILCPLNCNHQSRKFESNFNTCLYLLVSFIHLSNMYYGTNTIFKRACYFLTTFKKLLWKLPGKYSYLRYKCAKRIYRGKLLGTSSGCFLHQSGDPARHEDTFTKLMCRNTRKNLTLLL